MGYKVSIKAAEDLEHIWLYTAENWSLEQADRYLHLIIDEFEYLAKHPDAGKDCKHIRKDYRCTTVKSHLIFFKQTDKTNEVEVIRVLHRRMDIENRIFD